MKTRIGKRDGHVHRLPEGDLMEHIADERCVCKPDQERKNKQEFQTGQAHRKLFIHNRLRDNPQ